MSGWITLGGTIRGAAHKRRDMPCQDAFLLGGGKNFYIACIADGHGSEHCPYSDEGAQAAVDTAAALLTDILETVSSAEAFAAMEANKEIRLPKRLEAKWKERVRAIHTEKARSAAEGKAFPYELYGTTLAALAATDEFIFAMQIGDGDILAIETDASVRWLIEPEYAPGNETLSLCMDNSWQYIRVRIVPLDNTQGEQPIMFLLSTDGYANSFSESKGFIKAGADIFKLWRDNGVEYIKQHLEDWLAHSSAEGSGDDITMALVMRG